jgi:hypothetical protein
MISLETEEVEINDAYVSSTFFKLSQVYEFKAMT